MNPRLTLVADAPGVRLRRADRARQMADVLRRQVMHGLLEEGVLPSESALVSDFGVSRNTVREALELLRREGLIQRIPGVGTVATRPKYLHGIDELRGLAETLPGPVRNEVRVAGLVEAPAAVAHRLGLNPGEPVTHLERRRFADEVPISLDLTYLPADVGAPLIDEDLAGRDVFALLEELTGRRLGAAEIVLEAIAADRHSAALHEVPAGAPLLMLERLTRLDDGRPVDLEFVRFRGDRITMRGQVRRTPEKESTP